MTTSKKNSVSMKQQQLEMDDKHGISDNSGRELWIKESAYFMAQSRGFIPGFEQEDWNTAEKKYENIASL